ncbi:DUF2066 domain-containing protein [Marinomonas sp. 2405UD68-3]|uniref:DUF2066 domain-containing protein n=1 Tax=Marinomonas sp. 2405UD68-3 TaxID=3391835 RepID=UPI0039C96B67
MKSRILILILLFFWVPVGLADTVTGLYRSEIILPSSLNERQLLGAAFKQAAKNVLIKVSGRPDLIESRVKDSSLQDSANWVAQHSVLASDELIRFNEELVETKKVVVTFYEQSINLFLIDRNIAIWGGNRPSILLWLIEENGLHRSLSGVNKPSPLLAAIANQSTVSGLPIYAPILDEVDKNALSPSELWGFFEGEINNASERYQTDLISAVRVSRQQGQFIVDLRVYFPLDEVVPLRFTTNNESEIAITVNHLLSQLLSERYAAVRDVNEEFSIKMRLIGLDGYNTLQKVQDYLDSITLIRSWSLSSLNDEEGIFIIQSDGGIKKLRDSISLDSILRENKLNALDPSANIPLSYEYNGR